MEESSACYTLTFSFPQDQQKLRDTIIVMWRTFLDMMKIGRWKWACITCFNYSFSAWVVMIVIRTMNATTLVTT